MFLPHHSVTIWQSPFIGTLITGTATFSLTFPLGLRYIFSEGTVQSVVVVFEVLKLQEVSGPFAALLCCRCEVGGLGGGRRGACRLCGRGQVFCCRLMVLVRSAAATVRLHTERTKGETDCSWSRINILCWD